MAGGDARRASLNLRRFCAGLVPLALIWLLVPRTAFAWGENADRLIANKAVDTLPPEMQQFFSANRQYLVAHVTDPAEAAGQDAPAARNGFIRLDHYGQFPFDKLPRSYDAAVRKYGHRTINEYGLLPWQIGLYSQKLTDALRARDWPQARILAATLAYYVAASHDPFNTTGDDDGNLSGQPGVEQRFGTGLVDRYQLFFFVRPNEAAFVRDPTDYAFGMALGAHSWLENILLADLTAHQGLSAYNDAYYDRFYAQAGAVLIRLLTDAATDTGSYWMTAWINAGRPQLPSH
jgi:hypothetical protein